MYVMDLKSKGMIWVGNIYQRFETICHEMDNIVNQDAVKFVENQVQLVGQSMKKVCSDVVQIVEPVRCEAQVVALKGNAAVGTYIKSIIGKEEDRGRVVPMRHPHLEPSDFASSTAFDDLKFEYQTTMATPGESHQGTELDLAGTMGVVSTNENCDQSMDGNANEKCSALEALDLIDFLEKDLTNALQSHELINNDNENSCVSLDEDASSASVNGQDALPSQEVELVYVIPADVSDSLSDISTAFGVSEMAFPVESCCDSTFTEPYTLPRNSLNDILAEIESYSDAGNEAAYISEYSGSLISSASPPILSSNKEEEGTGLTFSNSVLSVESTDTFISLSSPASSPIDSCNNGEAETGLSCSNSVMSLESTACSSCSTYVVDCAADSQMETVDLFDNLKLDERCVIVDNSMLYDVARRIQRQRSYKDAFSTRKRVSKEYEQLTIWFGELDTESSQNSNERPSNNVALDHDMEVENSLDSEWELL